MAKQVIGIGTLANDGTGDPLRVAMDKVNGNFTEVYNSVDELETLISELSEDKAVQDVVLFSSMGGDVKAFPVLFDYGRTVASMSMFNERAYLVLVDIPYATTLTGVRFLFGDVIGNYIANYYNGIGLYKVDGDEISLVAQSADDGDIWINTATSEVRDVLFSSSYSAESGLYYISLLCNHWEDPSVIPKVSIYSLPALHGSGIFGNTIPFSGYIDGQNLFAESHDIADIENEALNTAVIACLI